MGAGILAGADPAALLLQFGILKENRFFAVRLALLTEAGTGYDGNAWDLGVVAGRGVRGWLGHAAVGAGVSLAGCDNPRDVPKCDHARTLGVPLVAEVGLRLLPIMGVGLQAFANLNTRTVFGGVVAFVQIGALPR